MREVGEQRVASFAVAVNRKNSGGQKQTLWVRVNCWNKLADVAAQYVHKGSLVQVTTEWMRPSAWIASRTATATTPRKKSPSNSAILPCRGGARAPSLL